MVDPHEENFRNERFPDEVHRSQRQPAGLNTFALGSSQEHDRESCDVALHRPHPLQCLESVHSRHHYIEKDKVRQVLFAVKAVQKFLSRSESRDSHTFGRQDLACDRKIHIVVIDYHYVLLIRYGLMYHRPVVLYDLFLDSDPEFTRIYRFPGISYVMDHLID